MRHAGTMVFLRVLLLSCLAVCFGAVTAGASNPYDCCSNCHGSTFDVHGNFDHTATPGSGPVVLFEDNQHDNAGWVGETPYFDVTVDCTLCHNVELPEVHGNDCATCHPDPYHEIWRAWDKTCQQGGCHATYHPNETTAHLPFEDASDPTNDCSRCHDPATWNVTPDKCLNCHAGFMAGDTTLPVTTSNAQAVYNGAALIDFSITKNGKVAPGRTFYQLDEGAATAAGKNLLVTTPGAHQLKFWSKDQYGNTELTPTTVFFNIVLDNTPPTTTSDVQASYTGTAVINLTATDAGSGVKETRYILNGAAAQTGNQIVIAAASGTVAYALEFWSEDWVGNVEEPHHSVNFTVTGTTYGTIRLVWGNSDTTGSPCGADPEAAAAWNIFVTGASTPLTSGSGACPGWSGVTNITVPTGATTYSVLIDWYDSGAEDWYQSAFHNVQVTTEGQVVRLSY